MFCRGEICKCGKTDSCIYGNHIFQTRSTTHDNQKGGLADEQVFL